MTKISPFPWTPKTHGKMKVTCEPPYMDYTVTPRNEGNRGFPWFKLYQTEDYLKKTFPESFGRLIGLIWEVNRGMPNPI